MLQSAQLCAAQETCRLDRYDTNLAHFKARTHWLVDDRRLCAIAWRPFSTWLMTQAKAHPHNSISLSERVRFLSLSLLKSNKRSVACEGARGDSGVTLTNDKEGRPGGAVSAQLSNNIVDALAELVWSHWFQTEAGHLIWSLSSACISPKNLYMMHSPEKVHESSLSMFKSDPAQNLLDDPFPKQLPPL